MSESYRPSQATIAREAAKIRAGWDKPTRRERWVGPPAIVGPPADAPEPIDTVETPVCHVDESNRGHLDSREE